MTSWQYNGGLAFWGQFFETNHYLQRPSLCNVLTMLCRHDLCNIKQTGPGEASHANLLSPGVVPEKLAGCFSELLARGLRSWTDMVDKILSAFNILLFWLGRFPTRQIAKRIDREEIECPRFALSLQPLSTFHISPGSQLPMFPATPSLAGGRDDKGYWEYLRDGGENCTVNHYNF